MPVSRRNVLKGGLLALGFPAQCAARALAEDDKKPSPRAAQGKILISQSTTFLTEPLTSEGYVNYPEALNRHYGAGVKPEENAALRLWQIHHEPKDAEYLARFYMRMGAAPPAEEKSLWISLQQWVPDSRPTEVLEIWEQKDVVTVRPWSEGEFPRFHAWLQANEPALALATEASRCPKFFFPYVGNEGDSLFDLLPMDIFIVRSIGDLLVARAMLRLQQRNYAKSWDDLLTVIRLGRLISHGPTIIENLIGSALESAALNGAKQYLQHAPLDGPRVQSKRRSLQVFPPRFDIVEKLNLTERCSLLDETIRLMREPKKLDEPPSPLIALLAGHDQADGNVTLRTINGFYDRFIAILRMVDRPERRQQLEEFRAQMEQLASPAFSPLKALQQIGQADNVGETVGRLLGERLAAQHFDNIGAFGRTTVPLQQEEDLVQLGFRMAAYYAAHQKYPPSLAALKAFDNEPIPPDRCTGNDLQYRAKGGGYLLYSVGVNEKDDGGRSTRPLNYTGEDDPDDIAMRITGKG